MDTVIEEKDAQEALRVAVKALLRAGELCEAVGYGSLVMGPLADAQREANYALETALGKN